jgi:predicted KAP-like P-loop ATPase
VWFAPWSARSWDDLWAEFAAAIVEALEAQNPAPKSLRKLKLKLLGRKTQKHAKQQQFLDVDGADFQTLLSELGGRRVIIFVDDLDRVDPCLVPQLLLALRELLDLPGFVFVLAFDDKIVSKALTAYHKAWDTGQAFLEKIIDFRFPVPRTTFTSRSSLRLRFGPAARLLIPA